MTRLTSAHGGGALTPAYKTDANSSNDHARVAVMQPEEP